MKICKRCGAIQEDDHTQCIDCGEYLGSPLSKEEVEALSKKVSDTINKLSNNSDYFYVSRLDKVIAGLHLLGAVALILLLVFIHTQFIWECTPFLFSMIILMLFEIIDIMFPRLSWALYRMRFTFTVSRPEDIQPSEFVAFLRRKISYLVLIIGYGLVTIILLNKILL